MPEYYKCYLFSSYFLHFCFYWSFSVPQLGFNKRNRLTRINISQSLWDPACSRSPQLLYIHFPFLTICPQTFKLQHRTCRQWPHRDCLNNSHNCVRPDLYRFSTIQYKFTIQSPKTSFKDTIGK